MNVIFGGTGFLGEALIKRLYPSPLRVVARNEGKLIALKQQYPGIEILPGDIANPWIVKKAMQGADEIYLLSAMKHVGMAEEEVFQCINTNIIGTMNILSESFITKPSLIIGISTDKASQVSGIYGATKLCMEGLFREAERMNPDTKYRIVKYGNVLYSTGSVLCKWKESILNKKPVTITNPESTRFYWTREQAVDHIFECLKVSKDATPYIPEMKSARLGDLLQAMLNKYGKTEVITSSLNAEDNVHETMDGKVFSNEVPKLTITELEAIV